MATDTIECPDCGAEIDSEDQVDVEEVSEIESRPRGGIGYGPATKNLYLCKNCKKPLGVGNRE
jgi:DNA-directed RNA polymerase subunit RPC12/RpoP